MAAGNAAEVEKLLQEGADAGCRRIYETVDMPETTALREAIRSGNEEVLQLLLRSKPGDGALIDAMLYLPGGYGQTETVIGTLFVTELLVQGRSQLLRDYARYIQGERALKKVLESGPVADPRVLLRCIETHSWETANLMVDGLPDVTVLTKAPEPDKRLGRSAPGILPNYLLSRAQQRPHEEQVIVEFITNLSERGLPPTAWGGAAKTAAERAMSSGLVQIAKALDPEAIKRPGVKAITDEDCLASAIKWEDSDAVEQLRKSGVLLRGCSRISATQTFPRTLAQMWVAKKAFDRFTEFGVEPNDWDDPEDDPYLAAKDFDSVRWLIDHGASASRNPSLLSGVLMRNIGDKIRVAEALVAAGAGLVQKRGEQQWSILTSVVLFEMEGDRVGLAKALMKMGADPAFKNPNGKSPMEQAEETLQLDLLAALDPGRASAIWKKYQIENTEDFAGVWSNEKGEFKTVTLMLFDSGEAQLHGAAAGAPGLWRRDGSGGVEVDLIEGSRVSERKLSATIKLKPSKSEAGAMDLQLGDDVQVLKRLIDGPGLVKALEESHQKASSNVPPNAQGIQNTRKSDDPEEARKRGVDKMRSKPWEVTLENWPDETLPEDFHHSKLNGLRIRGGKLRHLPDDIDLRFPNLTFLTIENVRLAELPRSLEKLSKLKRLTLTGNDLTALPDLNFPSLENLDLHDNRLQSIPQGWIPGSLQRLDVSNNRLARFSTKDRELDELTELDVSANQISEFELGGMPKLYRIDLSENRLRTLPPGVGACVGLVYLTLDVNRLSALPESMNGALKLRVLQISYNDFRLIPKVLDRMPALGIVGFRGNPVPEDILIGKVNSKPPYRFEWTDR